MTAALNIRELLKNEITWALVILAAVWGFVTTVVLPLQDVRLTVTQIQKDIATIQRDSADVNTRLNNVEHESGRHEERIKALERN